MIRSRSAALLRRSRTAVASASACAPAKAGALAVPSPAVTQTSRAAAARQTRTLAPLRTSEQLARHPTGSGAGYPTKVPTGGASSRSSRSWSFLPASSERRLRRLAEEADLRPGDVEAQAAFLRALVEVRPAEVVSRVEAGAHVNGAAVAKEYVRALVKTGELKQERLPSMLAALSTFPPTAPANQAVRAAVEAGEALSPTAIAFRTGVAPGAAGGAAPAAVPTPAAASAAPVGRAVAAGAPAASAVPEAAGAPAMAMAAAASGTNTHPFVVQMAEPSTAAQLWRLARAVGTTFIILGFIGVLLEERGPGGIARVNTSAEPEPESSDPKTFADVAGADEAKEELQEIVEYLRSPSTFTRLGGKLPKGVLLVGPPGTGKTLLARAVAGEAHRPFFYASGSAFEELYVGVGAKRVRELFAAAKRQAPCIVFIDEIDAIGGKRNPKDSSYMKLTLNELLVQLDGFASSDEVIVIAATNSPESLDPALVRPGRFDRHVVVPNPDVNGRRQILAVHTKSIPLAKDVNLDIIARGTPGFSGADLANLVNMAAIRAAVQRVEAVGMLHLEEAKDKIIMGSERKSAAISEATQRLTAYHEGGHALMAIYTPGALPVHKATIVPRGQALGMVSQLPDADMTSMSKRQMLAKLLVCMGGRAAEEVIFGEDNVTSGASSDFDQATKLAEAMVTQYGMSEKLGHVTYERSSESPETRALIEREIKALLEGAYTEAKELLIAREAELHNLASALLEHETLHGEDVKLAAKGQLPKASPKTAESRLADAPSEVSGSGVLDAPNASTPSEPALQVTSAGSGHA